MLDFKGKHFSKDFETVLWLSSLITSSRNPLANFFSLRQCLRHNLISCREKSMKKTTTITLSCLIGIMIGCSMQTSAKPANLNTSANTSTVLYNCRLAATQQSYPCIIGRNGVNIAKKEGDGTTPVGTFLVRRFFYRPDKLDAYEMKILLALQQRGFSVRPLTTGDAWSDDLHSPYYNQWIELATFAANKAPSHEQLWRNDDIYDIVAVLGYNDQPIILGKGSAIFLHIAHQLPDKTYQPTTGCIALLKPDFLQILSTLSPETKIIVPIKGSTVIFKDTSVIPATL